MQQVTEKINKRYLGQHIDSEVKLINFHAKAMSNISKNKIKEGITNYKEAIEFLMKEVRPNQNFTIDDIKMMIDCC